MLFIFLKIIGSVKAQVKGKTWRNAEGIVVTLCFPQSRKILSIPFAGPSLWLGPPTSQPTVYKTLLNDLEINDYRVFYFTFCSMVWSWENLFLKKYENGDWN